MIIPPSPGNVSCTRVVEVRSLSIPADSNSPLTIIASDSSSESKTFTSFSFGSGRRGTLAAGFVGSDMRVSNSGYWPDSLDFTLAERIEVPGNTQNEDCSASTQEGHLRAVAFLLE